MESKWLGVLGVRLCLRTVMGGHQMKCNTMTILGFYLGLCFPVMAQDLLDFDECMMQPAFERVKPNIGVCRALHHRESLLPQEKEISAADFDFGKAFGKLRGASFYRPKGYEASGTHCVKKQYQALLQHASDAQILKLLESDNPITLMYALDLYRDRFGDPYFHMALTFMSDHREIPTAIGCSLKSLGLSTLIFSEIVQHFRPIGLADGNVESLSSRKDLFLKTIMTDAVETLAEKPLTKAHQFLLERVFAWMEIPETYENDVAYLADNGVDGAFRHLMKWQPENHLLIFEARLSQDHPEKIIDLLADWPHPHFAPFVDARLKAKREQGLKRREQERLYKVLVAYPPKFGHAWLDWEISRIKRDSKHRHNDGYALMREILRNDLAFSYYGTHLFQIGELLEWVDSVPWEKLHQLDDEQTVALIYNLLCRKPTRMTSYAYVLKTLQQLEPKTFPQHLNQLLPLASGAAFAHVLKAATPVQSQETYDALLQRLAVETNPGIIKGLELALSEIDPSRLAQGRDR